MVSFWSICLLCSGQSEVSVCVVRLWYHRFGVRDSVKGERPQKFPTYSLTVGSLGLGFGFESVCDRLEDSYGTSRSKA